MGLIIPISQVVVKTDGDDVYKTFSKYSRPSLQYIISGVLILVVPALCSNENEVLVVF